MRRRARSVPAAQQLRCVQVAPCSGCSHSAGCSASMSAPDPAEASEPPAPAHYWAGKDNYAYWASKATVWPVLHKVALWWIATSERTFALGRIIDVPRRGAMEWGTYKRVLTLRLHQPEVEKLTLHALQRMRKARTCRAVVAAPPPVA